MIAIERSQTNPKNFRLVAEQRFDVPRAELFSFFADAFQLERITPRWLHFGVTTTSPIEMRAGALIDYKLRLHGISMRWKTEIAVWDPPYHFVDRQLRGPYSLWHHEHFFTEEDGKTLVRDVVDYRVPLGFLVHGILVKPDLHKIFRYRQQALAEIFAPTPIQISKWDEIPAGLNGTDKLEVCPTASTYTNERHL